MEIKPEKWSVVLSSADPDDAVWNVIGMMRLLWHGQQDRHGTSDESTPIAVSSAEAEAAIQLAIPLVRWFSNATVGAR